MTQAYLEHANVTVRNPEASANMLKQLFGWKVRWSGAAMNGGFTVHVGTDDHYVAFYTGPNGLHADAHYPKSQPLNHLAFVVDDLDEVERRVIALGLEPINHGDYDPGRRFYFFDENGIEYEVVSYT